MKPGYVLLFVTFFSLWLSWTPAHAMQDNPVLIRGPVGAEQTDVRVGTEQYGPVAPSDTLWGIANRFRPHSGVTLAQVMVAILQANPHAFLENNPNALESGYLLRIPSVQEMRMINPEAARRQIELGEQIQQSAAQLQRNQAAAQQSATQGVQLLDQTRQQAEQTLAELRGNYAGEFEELRDQLGRSIVNTETVIAENEDLRERLNVLNETLEEIQRTMVAETEFRQQVRELMEEQQALRIQQQAAHEIQRSQGGLQDLISRPWVLLLLAFLPALLLIIIATLVLRRKQSNPPANFGPVPLDDSGSNRSDVKEATSEQKLDDFELDQAMAGFDDLDDDGDDLSALEDEMLVPHASNEDNSQLDDDLDNMNLSDFDALDDDLVAEFTAPDDSLAEEQNGLAESDESIEESIDEGIDLEADSQQLSQSDLDALLNASTQADSVEQAASDAQEPSPSGLFEMMEEDSEPQPLTNSASDDMSGIASVNQEQAIDDADELAIDAALDDDDDYDFERMLEQFADDDDEDLAEDDIDSLLAKSDQMINQADGFIDIDSILDEAEADSEFEDDVEEPQSETSRRADAEDNLAAQLDLARAYMEMGEHGEARETIESVITHASGELLQDAKELLSRLDS